MKKSDDIQIGDKFCAVVKLSKESKTLAGIERAGKISQGKCQVATKVTALYIETNFYRFLRRRFYFRKIRKLFPRKEKHNE